MQMHGGLELARPRRRKGLRMAVTGIAIAALLVFGVPRLWAAAPAGWAWLDSTLGSWLVPRYTDRLTELQQQNAALHTQLAQAEEALAENEAMRSLLGCARTEGNWQPGRVVARRAEGATLACTAAVGAAVVDPQGRYVGCVVDCGTDTCEIAFAGSKAAPCAGLSGAAAGLLEQRDSWWLTGLPADCGLTAGAVVTTPGGEWLGVVAGVPQTDSDGLTACVALTDTADLGSTVFFVKNS